MVQDRKFSAPSSEALSRWENEGGAIDRRETLVSGAGLRSVFTEIEMTKRIKSDASELPHEP